MELGTPLRVRTCRMLNVAVLKLKLKNTDCDYSCLLFINRLEIQEVYLIFVKPNERKKQN